MQLKTVLAMTVMTVVLLSTMGYAYIGLSTTLTPSELSSKMGTSEFYYSLGTFLASRGYWADAASTLEVASTLGGDVKTAYNLGYTYLKEGDREAAREQFLNAAVDPLYAKPHKALGIMALEDQDYQSAITHLTAAILADGTDPTNYFNLGLAHTALFRVTGELHYGIAAKQAFQHALALDPSFEEAEANVGVLSQFV